jgi:hypothetical protein
MASALALLLLSTAAAAAEEKSPDRKVEGTTVTSSHDPEVKITLPETAQYVGAARWDLYGFADAEVHVVRPMREEGPAPLLGAVQAFLPDNERVYKYLHRETTIAGLEFDVNAATATNLKSRPGRTGSGFRHGGQAGYVMAAEQLNVRLVHLIDEARRADVIYGEDLAMSNTTTEELNKPGGQEKWEGQKAALIERAKERVKVEHAASDSNDAK